MALKEVAAKRETFSRVAWVTCLRAFSPTFLSQNCNKTGFLDDILGSVYREGHWKVSGIMIGFS